MDGAALKERQEIAQSEPSRYQGLDRQFIAGQWRDGRAGKRGKDTSPWTRETLVEIALADARDVDEAYRKAEQAQPAWASARPQERAAVFERAVSILEARRREVMDWLVRESGGTQIKAALECDLVAGGLREVVSYPWHVEGRILPAGINGKESRVYRAPVGVVGVVSPWNFPFQLSNRSVAPALALGNAVVLKPASDTPITGGLLLAKIFEEAGLPAGLLSVVIGSGNDIGDAVIEHPVPRVISFTGSTPLGRHIAERAGRNLKKVCLELGGNGPFIVLDDADLELAINAAVAGKFMHQGQICMAINRIIVDAAVYDQFVESFLAKVRSLKVGDRDAPDTAIGPIINESQLRSIRKKIDATLKEGARVLLKGEPQGLVLPPCVLVDVKNNMTAAREELFGPVAPILKVSGEEEAIAVANDTELGLSSAIITRDVERGVRLGKRLQVGMTHINDAPINDEPNTAFGGEKGSGLGRFGGRWAVEELTTDHWISVQSVPRAFPF